MNTLTEPIEFLGRDPIGIALGSHYQHFRSPHGCHGLAWLNDKGVLEILALDADEPGTGQCRAFIAACKEAYRRVTVLHVDNPLLRDALKRWGFRPYSRRNPDGEKLTGWTYAQPV